MIPPKLNLISQSEVDAEVSKVDAASNGPNSVNTKNIVLDMVGSGNEEDNGETIPGMLQNLQVHYDGIEEIKEESVSKV